MVNKTLKTVSDKNLADVHLQRIEQLISYSIPLRDTMEILSTKKIKETSINLFFYEKYYTFFAGQAL